MTAFVLQEIARNTKDCSASHREGKEQRRAPFAHYLIAIRSELVHGNGLSIHWIKAMRKKKRKKEQLLFGHLIEKEVSIRFGGANIEKERGK